MRRQMLPHARGNGVTYVPGRGVSRTAQYACVSLLARCRRTRSPPESERLARTIEQRARAGEQNAR